MIEVVYFLAYTGLRWGEADANVKAVQRMLGHASAAMTLDTYADLFNDDLDHVADAVSRARLPAPVVIRERERPGLGSR